MGHAIFFKDFDPIGRHLPRAAVTDLIDVMYRWNDDKFVVAHRALEKNVRGKHQYDHEIRTHLISLYLPTIETAFSQGMNVGGNMRAPSLKMSIAMVLAHEIQHANQQRMHRASERFYSERRYKRRPCEREARHFVDDHMLDIAAIVGEQVPPGGFGAQPPRDGGDHMAEILDIADAFEGVDEVSVRDLVQELRASGITSPNNVIRLRGILEGRGVRVA